MIIELVPLADSVSCGFTALSVHGPRCTRCLLQIMVMTTHHGTHLQHRVHHVQMYVSTCRLQIAALRLGLSQRKRDLPATTLSNKIGILRHHRHFADGTMTFGLPLRLMADRARN